MAQKPETRANGRIEPGQIYDVFVDIYPQKFPPLPPPTQNKGK